MARRNKRGAGATTEPTEQLFGQHAIEEALRARRRRLARLLIRRGPFRPELEPLVELAKQAGVAVEQVEASGLPSGAGPSDAGYQGVVLEAGPLPTCSDVRQLLREQTRSGSGMAAGDASPRPRRLVALDGVEDPQNVGALARVASAAGVDGLVLSQRRSPPLSPALARASAGAIEWLPVARVPNLGRALTDLKREGYWVVGADPQAEETIYELSGPLVAGDLVVVLGAEGRGIRTGIRRLLDHPVRIPMQGDVASLNVATAGAVILFELLRRTRSGPAATEASSRPAGSGS